MKSRKKGLAVAAATLSCALLAPAAAHATVSASVTGDDGNPAALTVGTPLPIHNMDVKAFVHVDAGDASSFQMSVTDPSGTAATLTPTDCWPTSAITDDNHYIVYRGNGTYTLTLALFSDKNCATAKSTATYQ